MVNMGNSNWKSANGRHGGHGSLELDDGNDEHVSTGYTHNYNSGITAALWFYSLPTGHNQYLISNGGGASASDGTDLVLVTDNDLVWAAVSGDPDWSSIASNFSLNDNQWYHAVGTWDGTTDSGAVEMYIDGISHGTSTASSTLGTASKEFLLGRLFSSSSFNHNGFIDDIRVYDRALSATEVRALYDASQQGYPDELNRDRAINISIEANLFLGRNTRIPPVFFNNP